MGTCASLHKDPASAVAARPAEAKAEGAYCEAKVADSGLSGSDFGSKDDIFFDSKAWIDSDCDDDFFSVKGDFTPSRGSTPVHPLMLPDTPRLNKTFIDVLPDTPRLNKTFIDVLPDTPSEPSPRKKLSQLLLETSADGGAGTGQVGDQKTEKVIPAAPSARRSKSFNGISSYWESNFTASNQTTPRGGLQSVKAKNEKAMMQCCLPSVHSFSVYEWKKQRASPMHQTAVKA